MDRPPSLSLGTCAPGISASATMPPWVCRCKCTCTGPTNLLLEPRANGARGNAQVQVDGGGKTGGWVGALPQKEMNGGSDAKRRAALAAESREMAEEQSQ